jgi:endogenous inhibitor of DNA gyrase (YacG/DUF329 family)
MKSRCPICRKVVDSAIRKQSIKEKFYPFCSTRCKWIDLGRWLDEEYRIEGKPESQQQEPKKVDKPGVKADNNT